MNKKALLSGIVFSLTALTGCGGGSSSSVATTTAPTTNQAVDGILIGTLTSTTIATNYKIIGVITPGNELRFATTKGVQYIGTASVSGNKITAPVKGLAPLGFVFLNGKNTTVGNIKGTVVAGKTLNGTYTASKDNGTFKLSYSSTYNRPASLGLLAKKWSGSISNGAIATVNISKTGVITGSDTLGCSYKGAVKVIDPTKNIYSTTLTSSVCSVPVTYKGFIILQDIAPKINNQLDFMVSNVSRSFFGQLK
ncbi:MAG: hypothetical protein COA61_000955 [Zetaproteobacteria bacterium]|nr:hypothetical protein [Zetaproteobacteria bacterium]